MKKTGLLILMCFALGLCVVSCGSMYEKEPVGIGIDHSELKRSPCACLQLDLDPSLPDWFLS